MRQPPKARESVAAMTLAVGTEPEDEARPTAQVAGLAADRRILEQLGVTLESASFYGAQMSAMDNATRNAGDMIRKQTLIYNRTRQAMITKELIEIISGAEAL